jgi:L-fuculose-phosphate aldolase
MLLKKERNKIIEYGLKLKDKNLVKLTGGNLSIYNRKENLIAISPSGIPYENIKTEDVVIIDPQGQIVEGKNKPSTEYRIHTRIYRNLKEINAVIHTHPTYCTTISSMKEEIPPIHYLIAYAGQKVPCAKYAPFGTKQLARNTLKALGNKYKAVLLANHGLVTIGEDIKEALNITEIIEYVAEIFYRTKSCNNSKPLSKKQIRDAVKRIEDYK